MKPCAAPSCKVLTRNPKYCDEHVALTKAWATRQGSGRGGRPWRRLRDQVLRRDGYLCQCDDCQRLGRVRPADEVDHVTPLCRGGKDLMSNLRAINHECHRLKTQAESQAARRGR